MSTSFIWYELAATDPAASSRFYAAVVGWVPKPFEGGGYTIMEAGREGVAGITAVPAGGPTGWTGYLRSDDVDADCAAVAEAGGSVRQNPSTIPGIGRIAALADPEGAPFALIRPDGPDRPRPAPMTPGHVGWHERLARSWPEVFAFYAALFGWKKGQALEMGPAGTYQIFAMDGDAPSGGIMNRAPGMPEWPWLFYFVVNGLDAAAERVGAAGGRVVREATEVPGGAWICQAVDPEGTPFALVSMGR